jgi:hypothetical protein
MEVPLVTFLSFTAWHLQRSSLLFLYAALNDYIATTATFSFNATQSQDCVNVPIIPDSIVEGSRKSFSGILDTRATRVTLNPATTVVTINDDDGDGK